MPGSNRSGDQRTLTDRRRRSQVRLPVSSVQVSRRVSAEQVSSYHMRVHTHPGGKGGPADMSSFLDNRDLDPGEAELMMVPKPYHQFLMDSAKNRPNELMEGLIGRLGEKGTARMIACTLGLMMKEQNIHEAHRWLSQLHVDYREGLDRLIGRSTWRQLVRSPSAADMIPLFGYSPDLLGEVALNSNTGYRQGLDAMRYLLPHIDKVLDTVDYVDLGHQQVFSTRSPNLIPSSVYPIRSYGTSNLSIAGSKSSWMYSPSKKYDLKAAIEENLALNTGKPGLVHLRPMGLLPRAQVQAFRLSSDGLRNSTMRIPWDIAPSVLSGFRVSDVTWDNHMVVPPSLRTDVPKDASELRQRLYRLTSRKVTSITQQVKEYGTSGFGEDEIDLYDRAQYRWVRGRRSTADEIDIVDRLFPHPLVRLVSMDYREIDNAQETRDDICRLLVSSLPLALK